MTQLFFGLSKIEDGKQIEIGEGDWQAFVADTLTPAFPDGFTVVDAAGHFHSATLVTARERARLVMIVHRADAGVALSLDRVVAEYKRRFAQQEVLRISTPVTLSPSPTPR